MQLEVVEDTDIYTALERIIQDEMIPPVSGRLDSCNLEMN